MIEMLLKLEMSLWVNETRNNYEYMNHILHDDFIEFGRSGKKYTKQDVLNSLDNDIICKFPFNDLNIKELNENTYLLTYQSVLLKIGNEEISNRSSVWLAQDGIYKLIFHQGTPTK